MLIVYYFKELRLHGSFFFNSLQKINFIQKAKECLLFKMFKVWEIDKIGEDI